MNNNGVILERLSGKKLLILVSILILFQVVFFLVGCFKFPNATHTESVEGIMCREKFESSFLKDKQSQPLKPTIYYLRDYAGRSLSNCDKIEVDENRNVIANLKQNEIVYAFQIPLPRDNKVLKLNRLFQTMTAILQLQVLFPQTVRDNLKLSENNSAIFHDIPLNVKLAYRNQQDYDDHWHLMASSREQINKQFKCYKNFYSLDCDVVQLFELGSVFNEFYAINIKLGEHAILGTLKDETKTDSLYTVNELPEVRLVITFIYQTGGFTQLWLITKTIVLPIVFIILCWFWNRVRKLERPSNLIEKMLLALGLATTLLNLPVEWLTLYYDLKFMLLYTDLRQGIFYCALFTFWIVFCGEHFVDDTSCSTMKSYWKYVGAVWFGFVCLLGFELAERGMQLSDPFFSVWDSRNAANLAMTMLILASVSCLFYFCLLLYLVFRVYLNFRTKQSQLPAMSKMRRLYYEGIIYRFKFLIGGTLFCAAMTISYFIINNVNEAQMQLSGEEPSSLVNYTAGFLMGVYGLWNIYVSAVLIFYAPSHKFKTTQSHQSNETDESIEFVNLQARVNPGDPSISVTTESVLTAFANKIASS